MDTIYATRKSIVGLKSVMPLVWVIKNLPKTKTAFIYFSKRVPWKFLCLWWSLSVRFKFASILSEKQLTKIKKNPIFETVVVFGTVEKINWFKTKYPYQNLIVIEDTPGLTNHNSCIVYQNHKPHIDAKYLPYCVYGNFHHKWKDILVYKQHFIHVLKCALYCFSHIHQTYIDILCVSIIKELLDLAKQYQKWENILKNKKRNPKAAITLEQIDINYYQLLNNVLLNNLSKEITAKINLTTNVQQINSIFSNNVLNYWDECINQQTLKNKDVNFFQDENFEKDKELIKSFYVF